MLIIYTTGLCASENDNQTSPIKIVGPAEIATHFLIIKNQSKNNDESEATDTAAPFVYAPQANTPKFILYYDGRVEILNRDEQPNRFQITKQKQACD